jgi:hypothetical protein
MGLRGCFSFCFAKIAAPRSSATKATFDFCWSPLGKEKQGLLIALFLLALAESCSRLDRYYLTGVIRLGFASPQRISPFDATSASLVQEGSKAGFDENQGRKPWKQPHHSMFSFLFP